jgi:replicative DNA helicase
LESRENKRPMMSDLRQSGRLEEDADSIIMLHRPAAYGKVKDDEEHLLELVIRKNRNGPIGIVETYFHMDSVNIFNSLSELTTAMRKK